jgi:hypothetical protein
MDKHIVERGMLAAYRGLEIVRSVQCNNVSSILARLKHPHIVEFKEFGRDEQEDVTYFFLTTL